MNQDEQWLINTMRAAIKYQWPMAILNGGKIRIYTREGETKFTFYLDDFTDHIQETVVDLIIPFVQ